MDEDLHNSSQSQQKNKHKDKLNIQIKRNKKRNRDKSSEAHELESSFKQSKTKTSESCSKQGKTVNLVNHVLDSDIIIDANKTTKSKELDSTFESSPETPKRTERNTDNSKVVDSKLKSSTKNTKRKKKKKTENAEDEEPNLVDAKVEALNYLTQWNEDREKWSFKKVRQVWLLQHMFDQDKVSNEYFSMLLAYMEGMRGKAREVTQQKASDIMKQAEDSDSDQSKESDVSDSVKIQRARQVIQLLI